MKILKDCVVTARRKLERALMQTLRSTRGEMYVGEIIKIIIAVVLGILLLGALTYLFVNVLLPLITKTITEMFGTT